MISKLNLTEYTSLNGKRFFLLLFCTYALASHLEKLLFSLIMSENNSFRGLIPILESKQVVNCLYIRHVCVCVHECVFVCVCMCHFLLLQQKHHRLSGL